MGHSASTCPTTPITVEEFNRIVSEGGGVRGVLGRRTRGTGR